MVFTFSGVRNRFTFIITSFQSVYRNHYTIKKILFFFFNIRFVLFVFSFLSLLKILELLEYVIYISTNSCILQINHRRLIYVNLTSYSFKCIQETMLFMEQVMFCFDMNKTFVHSDSSLSMGKWKFDPVQFASKINRHSMIIDRSFIEPIKFHRSSKCKLTKEVCTSIF